MPKKCSITFLGTAGYKTINGESIMSEIFLENEIENFEVLEEDQEEQKAENLNSRVRCWVGTWNNPKMTDEEFEAHLTKLEQSDILQYAIFQREKGEDPVRFPGPK